MAIVNCECWWIRGIVHFLSTTPAAAYPVLYPTALPELQVELHICFGCGSCIFSEIINTFSCAYSGCKLNSSSFSLLYWTTGLTTAVLLKETFAHRMLLLSAGVKEATVSPTHLPCFVCSHQCFSTWNTMTYFHQRVRAEALL